MVIKTQLAILLASASLVCSLAIAQTAPPKNKDTAAGAAARQANDAARAAARGESKKEKDFLLEQALRASKIRKDAAKRTDEAEFFRAREATRKAQAANGKWAAQQMERVQAIGNGTIDEAAKRVGMEQEKPKPMFKIFLSQSMGQAGLKQAFSFGRGRPDVMYVFRGFKPGQSPMDFYKAMASHQGKTMDQMVQLALDPPAFSKSGITAVPAIVHYDDSGNEIAKVHGLVNFKWLQDKVKSREKGDLGKRGAVFAIAEPNLIDDMKRRAANYDYKGEGQKAKERYFNNLGTIDLPYAKEQRARKVQALLEVKNDVVDHNGVVRFKAGQRVSMKEELKRAPILVVFNSQDKTHVLFAKEMIRLADPKRKVILLTTRIDRAKGIAGYARQEVAIGRPVYLLMNDVKTTFGIERVPTVVTPTDDEFIVVEVPLTQGVSGNAGSHPTKR